MLTFVKKYLWEYENQMLLIIACSILTAASELATPYFISIFIDEILTQNSFNVFYSFLATIGVVCIAAIVANYIYIIRSTKIQFLIIRNAIQDITEHMQHISVEYIKENDMVYMSKRIHQDINDVIRFILGSMVDISIQVVLLVMAAVLLVSIDIFWLILLIVIAIFHWISYTLCKKKLRHYSWQVREKESRFFSAYADNYIYIISIKLHSLYKEFINRFKTKYEDYYSAGIKRLKLSFWFSYTQFNSGKIFTLVIFFIGGYKVLSGEMTLGNFVALNGYYMFAMNGIYYFMNIGQGYQNAQAAFSRIKELLNQSPVKSGNMCPESIEHIEAQNISYKTILNNVSFSFRRGKIYCIVGENGAGKTTFINLLVGILNPTSGEIRYNGIKTFGINMNYVRRTNISVVEQTDFLPCDKVIDNLMLGNNQNDFERNTKILNELGLNHIESMDNVPIMANNRLSGGEKRKISIARAFYKDATVIIMDEPDNNLDNDSLQRLTNIIENAKKNKIVILITHEPMLIKIADEILRL
ncbi:MAG: ABC transporter ATP-binding protein/permease [Selenomonadaceae bacterium]|nr:ABC transporter ATP-binding protein/permease [Selenomonadaceae bacterium]